MDGIEDDAGQAGRVAERQAGEHHADAGNQREAEHAADIGLRQRAENAEDHGGAGDPADQLRQHQPLGRHDHHQHAQQAIDADLGQQAAEQRRCDDLRRVVGGRQPEIDRESRRLHAEGDEKERGQRHQRRALARCREFAVEVGHVERAEHAVEIAGGDQEQRRGDKIEDGVFDRAVDPPRVIADHQQPERRDDEDLEPDIEVEHVAGQEGAADARHHQHQERIEAVAPACGVDVAQRIERADQADQICREAQQRTQHIDGKGDAERRQPAAHGHDQRPVGGDTRQQQAGADRGAGEPAQGNRRMQPHLVADHQAAARRSGSE